MSAVQYRKKPRVIEAFQFAQRNNGPIPYPDWFDDAVTRNDIITYNTGKWTNPTEPCYCEIKTLEGVMRAEPGDWIIRGVKGELYPCKADIFAATYDPAETTAAEAKQRLIDAAGDVPAENKSSLDETAENLLLRVSQFFGECVGGDTFCGLAIDETRDENGLLLSLRLVACDIDKMGEAVRRVGK